MVLGTARRSPVPLRTPVPAERAFRAPRSQARRSAVLSVSPGKTTPSGVARSAKDGRTTKVVSLPTPLMPGWLRTAIACQRVSLGLTCVLVGSAIAAYGWSIYSQQTWGKEYGHLEHLRRNARQLEASNELMKSDIAKREDPAAHGLVRRSADHTIFLKPELNRKPTIQPKSAAITPVPFLPVGY